MAMSIDDNTADEKSDKSRCQQLNFHCTKKGVQGGGTRTPMVSPLHILKKKFRKESFYEKIYQQ